MKVPRSFSYINNALYIQNTHNFPFIQHHRARLTLMPFDSSSTVCIWFFLCCVFFFFRFFCCFFGYIFTFISLLLRKCVFFFRCSLFLQLYRLSVSAFVRIRLFISICDGSRFDRSICFISAFFLSFS